VQIALRAEDSAHQAAATGVTQQSMRAIGDPH
jgi:hypothetical protein